MGLDELNVGDKAVITSIDCEQALKNRLYSFGVVKGASVSAEEITLAKSTMEVRIGRTKIALRFSEAKAIGVKYAR